MCHIALVPTNPQQEKERGYESPDFLGCGYGPLPGRHSWMVRNISTSWCPRDLSILGVTVQDVRIKGILMFLKLVR